MLKFILFSSFLFTSVALAHPFQNFQGKYGPVDVPLIQATGDMVYCNWMNFKNFKNLSISKNEEGTFLFELSSVQNNSPMSLTLQLKEHSFTNELGAVNSGELLGDETAAKFVQTNKSSDYTEIYTFNLSPAEPGKFTLYISEQYKDFSARQKTGACYYQISLKLLN